MKTKKQLKQQAAWNAAGRAAAPPGGNIKAYNEAQAKAALARRELARRRLLHFTKQTHPNYKDGWVHDDICRRLERFSQDVAAEKSPRLMLLMPPRHGKSELASIRFPAWHLGHHPEHEIINVGYNLDLPMKFSRKVREVVKDPSFDRYFPDFSLDPASQSVETWLTSRGGGFTAAGVGGGITGKGAHILIVDDPIKNQEEADSIVTRDSLWDWYWSTAYTRLAPGGGVLLIQCMTGDTPVLLPDGSERRLDALRPGDAVATYERGRLSASRVLANRSNGRDSVFRITMSSGRIVRANGRHPFLATTSTGELKWIRTRNLNTENRIVTRRGSEGSGPGLLAQLRDALPRLSVAGFAIPTTPRKSGPMGIVRRVLKILRNGERRISSTGMASRGRNTTGSWLRRAASALSAALSANVPPGIGSARSPLTTTTKQGGFEGCSATTATPESDTLELSPLHWPQPDTCDFTLEKIVSVEADGEEEVFDVQVERTENFIANGLVSHNTWWNDDDLAGRLQQQMARDPQADQFEVVKYPALADQDEYRHNVTLEIVRGAEPQDIQNFTKLRSAGDALHMARYDTAAMHRIKANQPPRVWSALYQQNPVPDEGMYFMKENFMYCEQPPDPIGKYVYTAWDFAIGEKQVNDWNVGVTIIQDSSDYLYVAELVRFKGDSFQIVEAIADVAARWSTIPGVAYTVGFEDGQIWKAIEPLVKRRFDERHVFPSYQVLKPLTDKMARARPLQGRMQQGRVFFPTSQPWKDQAITEMLRFPAGAHDDVVDALAWAVQLVIRHDPPQKPEQKPLPSWKDKLDSYTDMAGTHMAA